ncbi:aspartate aminotransferase family protein [Psychromonas aquimarina]|uniref:aspartate aminotransferase family protein n=1 Tax=Psychromonas aquimarina TaxID=444919 RepID=UPI00041ADCBA|nr:aminotransferase class III-fold pyridoxal phosphate-dependent enzyme [Psychromonas aquimarina]
MTIQVLNEGYQNDLQGFYVSKAERCYLYDQDGKQYIDMAMAGGSAILGHAQPEIQQALQQQLSLGSLYTAPTPLAHEYANLLSQSVTPYQDFIFCSTGSEATMRAIRIAKAYTGKKKIAVFSGCWHGSHDFLLIEEDYQSPLDSPRAALKSAGTPVELLEHLLLLPYNHQAAVKLIKEHANDIAMVFIEPVQGSNPRDDISGFLHSLRNVCNENNILLGFDEVITGGRLAVGGGQSYFNITADIATYGKTLGGGLPIGIVAGKKDIMDCIRNAPLFMGGTFSANPLSLTAGLTLINYLLNHPEIYQQINLAGQRLRQEINQFCQLHNINAHMMGVASLSRLVFCKRHIASRRERDTHEVSWDKQAEFYLLLKKRAVYIGGNRINFISSTHSSKVIDKVIKAYQECLFEWHQQGII